MSGRVIRPVALLVAVYAAAGCGRAAPRPLVVQRHIGPVLVSASDSAPASICEVFSVRNPSATSTMSLKLRRRSCNCTDYEIDPCVVPPGAETAITVRTTLPRITDKHHFWLLFDTAAPDVPTVEVSLKVSALARLSVEPAEWPEQRIELGQTADFEFEVHCASRADGPDEPLSVAATGSAASVTKLAESSVDDAAVRRSQTRWRASLQCPANASPGWRTERFVVRRGADTLDIAVRWCPRLSIEVRPPSLFLQPSDSESSPKRVALVGEEPFSIIGIRTRSRFVQAAATSSGKALRHELLVCVPRQAAMPRSFEADIEIETDALTPDRTRAVRVACKAFVLNLSGAALAGPNEASEME